MSSNVLEIKNLEKSYDKFKFGPVDLTLPKGCVLGLIGPNGAGKTTLIKLILEMIKKDNGNIDYYDKLELKDVKCDIGSVLDGAFFPEILKISDINKIMKFVYKNWDSDFFMNNLKKFNLDEKSNIKSLSTGMKKKLEIITALSHHPKLLILDEPTSGLDPIVRKEILDLFMEFVESEENSIIISSHITSDLEQIADYLLFINDGKIALKDNNININEKYGIIKCDEDSINKVEEIDIVSVIKKKYSYEILVSNKEECRKKYSNLVIDNAKIDDIMEFIVKGGKRA